MIGADARRMVERIVQVFETGSASDSGYGVAAVLRDGAGISYGRHQCTDRAGSLDHVVMLYLDLGGELLDGDVLRMLQRDESTQWDPGNLTRDQRDILDRLEQAGADPIMREAQDRVFDVHYWQPAARQALDLRLAHPLSWLVIYDSTIHSGPHGVARIRPRFPALPPSRGGDERVWVKQYVAARRLWLATHRLEAVRRTVYRMDVIEHLIDHDHWRLLSPVSLPRPFAGVTL